MGYFIHRLAPLASPLAVIFLLLLALGGCSGDLTRVEMDTRHASDRQRGTRTLVVETARGQIGVPYRYGGATPERGFDCSGLVHYSHDKAGLAVPRTSSRQRRASSPVSIYNLRPGDLVFFNISGKGGHVGIYAGNGEFIHAPSTGGRVRVERIDVPYWRQRLVSGGTFLGG
ncbi:MAG: C40 family peptidase [Gammaproteobacteria bacterium]|nr:C40 family peptidase [Gammaproteobacteria bacterium]